MGGGSEGGGERSSIQGLPPFCRISLSLGLCPLPWVFLDFFVWPQTAINSLGVNAGQTCAVYMGRFMEAKA